MPQDSEIMKSVIVARHWPEVTGASETSAASRLARRRASTLRLISAMIGLRPTSARSSHIRRRSSLVGVSVALFSIQPRIAARKHVGVGKSVSVSVDLGGRRCNNKKTNCKTQTHKKEE